MFTVSRELGHASEMLVNEICGHLGNIRRRSETVAFVAGQHREAQGERLAALEAHASRCGTMDGTAPKDRQ